jgi:transposase
MYLRVTKRKNKDSSVATYYQLAHNVRDPETKRPTPQIIHNFGRAEDIDHDDLKRLCGSIARVCGLAVSDPQQEGERKSEHQPASEVDLPGGIRVLGTVELGSMLAIEHLWEECGIGEVLRGVCKGKRRKVNYERALLAMTANRLCEPESKLGIWDRWLKDVYLPSAVDLKLEHMYEAMDLLYEHSAKVEEAIFFKVADLFNVQVDLIFYDTTSVSFAIDFADQDHDDEQNALRRFGHSKEGTWTPQVVVALAVTKEGIPVRSWVLPGNTADVTTVETVKNDLKGWKLGRALFVADSGMNSEDNREALGRACGKYVLACRVGSVKEIKEDVLSRPGRYSKISDNLHAKEVFVGDGVRGRRYILCYNPEQAKRERQHRLTVVDELKELLRKHKDRSATAQWAIEVLASRRYKRYLKVNDDKRVELDREAIRKAGRLDGKWVLITNDDTITVEDAASSYKNLLVIERCFRTLKTTQIRMRPMYHWLPHRITAHVKICVLALLLERIAVLRCNRPWSKVRRVLRRLQATEFDTGTHRFFRRNEVDSEVRAVMKSLGFSMPKKVLGLSRAP